MKKRFPQPKRWFPKNIDKYIGDPNDVIARSSWEIKFMVWADTNPQVLRWGSEIHAIPYVKPTDGQFHRYFPDFIMEVKNNSGQIKRYVVEVKPEAQTVPPKPRSRKSKHYLNEATTYLVNTAKWQAADAWCKKNGFEFIIITEKHLKI